MPTNKPNTEPAWIVGQRRYFVRDHGGLPGCKILFAEAGMLASPVAQERVVFELFRGVEELWRILREATTDRPWAGDGPSVAEAGGGSILVRIPNGDLVRSLWTAVHDCWRTDTGWLLPKELVPTGWRPMPKATGELSVRMTVTSDPQETWKKLRKITNPEELPDDEPQGDPGASILVCKCGKRSIGQAGSACPCCGSRSTREQSSGDPGA